MPRKVEQFGQGAGEKMPMRGLLTCVFVWRMVEAMRLDSARLVELRDQLRMRGSRASISPGSLPESGPSGLPSAAVRAIVLRVSPICEVLYLLSVADGREDTSELELLRGAVRALTDGALPTHEIDGMLAFYAAQLRERTRAERLEQVAALLSADRNDAEAAYMLAAAMVIADGEQESAEHAMLSELRDMLGIAQARARDLLD